jgi:hypothetical protein
MHPMLMLAGVAMALLPHGPPVGGVGADASPALRVIPGEVLSYSGDFGVFGRVGQGEMRVSGPECLRNRPVYRLDFSFSGRVMLMSIRDRTTSWIDAEHWVALRYQKEERHPVGSRTERVEILPEEGRWRGAGDEGGPLNGRLALDELSFIYLIRGLDLEPGESVELDRHFDAARSPVVVRHRGRDRIRVPAGTFDVLVLEMEVRDGERFGGAGRVVLHLSDDELRVPVRIASATPVVGSLVLVLEERTVTPGALESGTGSAGDLSRTRSLEC